MTENQSHPFMPLFQAKCHSSGDTQLRGRDPGILSELEEVFMVIQPTPFILHRLSREWPAGGSIQILSWRRPASVLPCLPLAQDFLARGSTHQPRLSSSMIITSIYPEYFPSRSYNPTAPPQASALGHFTSRKSKRFPLKACSVHTF